MKYIDIIKAAHEANGRSKSCKKCYFKERPTEHVCAVCGSGFVEGFQKGVVFLMKTQKDAYKDIIQRFNEDYGTDIEKRKVKLYEELTELEEALVNYAKDVRTGKKPTYDAIKDELGDVLLVITHVSHLLGTSTEYLLNKAVEKAEKRKVNPDYKRTHPHKNISYETEKRNN